MDNPSGGVNFRLGITGGARQFAVGDRVEVYVTADPRLPNGYLVAEIGLAVEWGAGLRFDGADECAFDRPVSVAEPVLEDGGGGSTASKLLNKAPDAPWTVAPRKIARLHFTVVDPVVARVGFADDTWVSAADGTAIVGNLGSVEVDGTGEAQGDAVDGAGELPVDSRDDGTGDAQAVPVPPDDPVEPAGDAEWDVTAEPANS